MRLNKILILLFIILFASCQSTNIDISGQKVSSDTEKEIQPQLDYENEVFQDEESASTNEDTPVESQVVDTEEAALDSNAAQDTENIEIEDLDLQEADVDKDEKSDEKKLPAVPAKISVRMHPLIPDVKEGIVASIQEDLTDQKRRKVMYLSIKNATQSDLEDMAKVYGVNKGGSIKTALFKKFGISEEQSEDIDVKEAESKTNSFKISSADVIQKKTINTSDFIFIDGNVSIEFESSGSSKTLSADSVLYDITENEILAFGNISVSSTSDGSQLQNIEADGLFMNFKNNKIHLESAKGSTQKSSSTYYMSGENIILDSQSSEIYFYNGALLPNDDVKNANWRIASRNIVMKSNGDMFMSGVLLKLGRVPILPLPALFMPGTPLVYNPAIGFASEKGAFINTTYEIFGKYPGLGKAGEGNSIINLLKSSSDGGMKKQGLLYVPSQESSSSTNYMALFADIYQHQGIFAGLDVDNNFKNDLSIKATGGLAYRPNPKPMYYSSSTYRDFRYILDSKLTYKKDDYTFSLSLPLYSDPAVKYRYLNRFTAFSFDSLFGSSQEFPSTYSTSSISDYEQGAEFSYSLPNKMRSKYIDSLTLNVSANHNRYWASDSSTSEYYRYMPNTTSLPNTTLSVSGTLFSLSAQSKVEQAKNVSKSRGDSEDYSSKLERELLLLREARSVNKNKDAQTSEDLQAPDESSDSGDEELIEDEYVDSKVPDDLQDIDEENVSDDSKSDDAMLTPLDILKKKRYNATAYLSSTPLNSLSLSGSSLSLKYSLSNSFTNTFQRPEDNKGIFGDRRTTNSLSGTVSLAGSLGSNILTMTSTLRPSYSYLFQESSNNLTTNDFSLTSSTQVSLPFFGVGYSLASQLYSIRTSKDDRTAFSKAENKFKFDTEHISTHSLSFSKTIRLFGFSVSGALPPISLSFNPSLSFAINGYSVSATHTVRGDNFDSLKSSQTDGRFAYSNNKMSTSVSFSYDHDLFRDNKKFLAPFRITQSLSFSLLDSWIRVSENITYQGLSSSGVENYFQSIGINLSTKKSYFTLNMTFTGPYNAIDLDSTKASVRVPTYSMYFWKRRIVARVGFVGSANLDFTDAYQNSLSYSINLDFEVKEFVSMSISLNGENNNFTKYTGDSRFGKFNIGLFMLDILRGINILDISDMRTSNFKMSSLSVSLVHDMGDWDFNFSFNGNFELDGNEYKFSPKYSIILKWKVIPELKVDKTIRP